MEKLYIYYSQDGSFIEFDRLLYEADDDYLDRATRYVQDLRAKNNDAIFELYWAQEVKVLPVSSLTRMERDNILTHISERQRRIDLLWEKIHLQDKKDPLRKQVIQLSKEMQELRKALRKSR